MKNVILRILWAVLGVLMIVAGIVCLCVPGMTEATLALAYGIILLISGIADIVIFAVWGPAMFGAGWLLLDGILTVLLSMFLLFNMGFTALALPYIFGMWLMFSGISKFVSSFDLRAFGVRGWGWMMALGIVMTAVGFVAFLDPVLSTLAMTVITGIMFMIYGISDIIHAIFANRFLK